MIHFISKVSIMSITHNPQYSSLDDPISLPLMWFGTFQTKVHFIHLRSHMNYDFSKVSIRSINHNPQYSSLDKPISIPIMRFGTSHAKVHFI